MFHLFHFDGLALDGHIAMDEPEATRPRMAIARREPVTVSMAAATIGTFSAILRVKRVLVSAAPASPTIAGSSRTSSNVKASGMARRASSPRLNVAAGGHKHHSPSR